ncbi:hypothetical protein J7K93_00490, partial [bacterium]|nr:hypothetical protein [bacterium]
MKKIISIMLSTVVLAASGVLAADRSLIKDAVTKSFHKTLKVQSGKTLYIKDSRADIDISRGNNGQVTANAEISVQYKNRRFEEKYLEECELILKPYADGFKITVNTPAKRKRSDRNVVNKFLRELFKGNVDSFSEAIKIKIKIPEKTNLNI